MCVTTVRSGQPRLAQAMAYCCYGAESDIDPAVVIWLYLNVPSYTQYLSGHTSLCLVVPHRTSSCMVVPHCTWPYLNVPGCTWSYLIVPNRTSLHLVVPGRTSLHLVVPHCA